MIWMLIAAGGALGAVARHALSSVIAARLAGWTAFPGGTFVVNVAGCFAAGVLLGLAARSSLAIEWRAFLAIGLLGGFTTFSAFGAETILLLQSGHSLMALFNVIASVVVALTAVWIGVSMTN